MAAVLVVMMKGPLFTDRGAGAEVQRGWGEGCLACTLSQQGELGSGPQSL